jgi:ribosomal protein S18 acetylase RimI-like enzyme
VRPARPDDFEFLFVTRRDGFRRYVEAHKAWDDEAQRANAAADFAAAPVEIIERDGVAIGYQIVERKPDHWWLDEIALVATERNRGIGSDLVRAVMAAARAAGLPVRLNCLRANPARHLYDRLGFRVIAEEDIRVRMEWP